MGTNDSHPAMKNISHGRKGVLPNSPPKLGGVARSAGVVPLDEIHDQAGQSRNISALEPPRLRHSKVASRHYLDGAATPPNLGGESPLPETFRQLSRSLTLRLFRPPLEATVQLRNKIPIWIAFHGTHGAISTASGPWRTSGDWWRPTTWDREEWDIEMAAALYRIYYDVHLDRWYAQGVYD